ncbi:PAS domain S-box protein [Thiovibrio sp. JS02]
MTTPADAARALWPKTIRSRLICGVALVHLLLMTVFVLDLVARQRDFLSEQSLEQTTSLAETLAINSGSWVLANDVVGLEEIVLAFRRYPDLHYAMVIDIDGQVLAHTDRSHVGQHLVDEKSLTLLKSGPESQVLHAGHDIIDIAAPIMTGTGEIIGWARIAQGQEKIADNLGIISRNGILYTLLAIAAGSLLAVLLGNRLTSGLTRLLSVSNQIKNGRRDLRMDISRQDEIALLGEGFNNMLDAIVAKEKLILLNQQRLESLARIFQFEPADRQELLDFALQEAIRLTGSKIGYICHYDEENREFIINSWSREAMRKCAVAGPPTRFQLDKSGLWGEAVRQGRPVIINDFQAENPLKRGCPPGHVELRNFLTIPVFREKRVVAVVGVANKATDYDQGDISQLSLLMDAVWKIVERRQAEEALREQRAMLQQILDTVPQSIFWKDAALTYLGCNRVFARAAGLDDPGQIRGKTDFDLPWPREEAEAYRADDQEVIDGKECKRHIVEPLQQADGNRIWIDTTKMPLPDGEGNVHGVLGIYDDITERKRAEEALSQSEENLRQAQRIARLGSWTLDLTGNKLVWSDEIYRIFEIDPAEFNASYQGFLTAIHPEDREAVDLAYTEALRNKTPYEITHRLLMKDGRVKFVHERGETVYDPEGRPLRTLGTVQDISEQKLAEQALARASREWSAAMDASDDVVYLLNLDRRIVRANKAFYLATGSSPETAVGRHVVELVHPGGEPAPCPICRAQEERRDLRVIMEADDPANPVGRPLEITVKIIRDQAERPMSILISRHDLSAARKETEEKTLLERQLRQAQKMEAIGTLAGGIAHDFNNILAIIFGYSELAMVDKDLESCRRHLEEVVRGAERAKELVRQILTFSRQADQQKQPLQVSLVVKEALKMLRASIPTTIDIRQEIISQATVLADPTQIHQIMMNLCTNAYHAMRETGGTLAVSLDEVTIGPRDFADADLAAGNYLKLEIRDTGCGIDQKIKEKIFEPYFTTKKRGEGTGMGLAVVHGIVKSHHGHITVESEVGKGASFRVYLPVTAQQAQEPPKPSQAEATLDGNGEWILVVDDEEQIREVVTAMLSKHGYRVTCAADGGQALAEFQKHADQYQLLLTDMTMPAMTGTELARRVLALKPGMPVILCTGQSEMITREKALAMGIVDFLNKPFVAQALLGSIQKALGKK